MDARVVLVVLLVLSTLGFVVGVSIEKSSGDSDEGSAAATTESGETAEGGKERSEEGEEGSAQHADEAAGSEEAQTERGSDETHEESGEDERLLGVDLEATPFVALAVVLSLALAVAVWLRPGWGLLLAVVAVALVVFGVLDVREVFHQLDEDKSGLAVLAGLVAALHLAAATVALTVARSAPARREAPA